MFTDKQINNLANLAKLESEDAQRIVPELKRILSLISQIDQVDTSNSDPMEHSCGTQQPLRSDTVTEKQGVVPINSPKTEADLFLVPQVIE